MSDFKRLQRIAKSMIPRFSFKPQSEYSMEDAHDMINDLGIQIPPKVLKLLLSKDEILDDFVEGVVALRREIKRDVLDEFGLIDAELEPQVLIDGQTVTFCIQHKKEFLIFAEYTLPELPPASTPEQPAERKPKSTDDSPPEKPLDIPID
jgi:hypothetical protein